MSNTRFKHVVQHMVHEAVQYVPRHVLQHMYHRVVQYVLGHVLQHMVHDAVQYALRHVVQYITLDGIYRLGFLEIRVDITSGGRCLDGRCVRWDITIL